MHGKFPSDGNTSMVASFLNRVMSTSGRPELEETRCDRALRSGIGEVNVSRNSCGQASEVGRPSVASKCENSESKVYHVVQGNHHAREPPHQSLDRPDLSFAASSLA